MALAIFQGIDALLALALMAGVLHNMDDRRAALGWVLAITAFVGACFFWQAHTRGVFPTAFLGVYLAMAIWRRLRRPGSASLRAQYARARGLPQSAIAVDEISIRDDY
jgi:hypothetical protein